MSQISIPPSRLGLSVVLGISVGCTDYKWDNYIGETKCDPMQILTQCLRLPSGAPM